MDRLSADQRSLFEAHVLGCAGCRKAVRGAEAFITAIRDAARSAANRDTIRPG